MDKTLSDILQQLTTIVKQQHSAPTAPSGTCNVPLPDIQPFNNEDESVDFEEWMDRFQFSMECAATNLEDGAKVKLIMTKLSPSTFGEYKRSCLPDEITTFGFDETKKRLKKVFARQHSLAIDRYDCLRAGREDGEEFGIFINRLKNHFRKFRYSEMNEDQFKCLVLLTALKAPNEAKLRQYVLSRLTAEETKTSKTPKLFDVVSEEMQTMLKTEAEVKILEQPRPRVNAVTQSKGKPSFSKRENFRPPTTANPVKKDKAPPNNCYRCGDRHWAQNCPKINWVCRKCSRKGHTEQMCEKIQSFRQNKKSQNQNPKMNMVLLPAALINSVNSSKLLRASIRVNGRRIEFILDTGADINVIDESAYKTIGSPPLRECLEEAVLFDGRRCKFLGKGTANFQFKGVQVEEPFYVAKYGALNLLGAATMDGFGFLQEMKKLLLGNSINQISTNAAAKVRETVEKLPQRYAQIFEEGLGLCTKIKAHLTLNPTATPVFRRARPVPYSALPVVNGELERLEKMKVITPVEHTEWAAPILVVKKANGSARLCADFSTGLNDSLQLHQHPLPLPSDIFSKLNGGKYFSKVDLSDAYLQIELDEESKNLCTIATHRGHFKYERMPFGVKSAPGIFQSIMDNMLADLSFALAYLDDIIIVSPTIDEHAEHVDQIFARLNNWGFRARMDKCSFFQTEIKYLGVIIDQKGRRPDPSKVTAIAEMPIPTNLPELRSYLGMVNYYQEFIRNFRCIRQPLDELLKADQPWNWTPKCQNAFNKIIATLQSDLALTHYDPALPIIVAADASQHGIGGVLSHELANGTIKAVSHFSRSLSPAEQNYGQIEKEALALVEAVKRFHKMIFGRKFTLLTDHQPLKKIFGNKSGVPKHSHNRLVRWSLILTAYDFDIKYVKTELFGQADALSRLISSNRAAKPDEEIIVASCEIENSLQNDIREIVRQLPITYKELVAETKDDSGLQQIMKFVKNLWPEPKNFRETEFLSSEKYVQFHRRKDDISIVNDCLMLGERIIIPKALQKQILKMLHQGHPGTRRMKSLARIHVYWPMLDTEIESFVHKCPSCALAAKNPTKTTLQSWPKTDGPWQRIHMDYAGPFHKKMYLIIVDSYSKYPEISEMNSTNSAATISKLTSLISRYGIPETLVSDNGTQFQSHQFRQFTKSFGIEHLFSAPYAPQSNGQAERMVDTFKRACAKIKGEGVSGNALETFLLTYRTTPSDTLNGKSPAELFLGRRPRIGLDLLRPPPAYTKKDLKMEAYFNRKHGARPRAFKMGEDVFARHRKSGIWRAGTITDRRGVIYTVEFRDKTANRFHANQLNSREITDEEAGNSLEILHETFGLAPPDVNSGRESRAEGIGVEDPPAETFARRYPARTRKPATRLDIADVRRPAYDHVAVGQPPG
uniref:RNA-directed DNA polymerase n=1 Tax=Globodera pallida TaxID=36090 RepID=A0A183CHH4_GLOPA